MRAYLRTLRPYLAGATLLFTLSLAAGFLASVLHPADPRQGALHDVFGWILNQPRPVAALIVFLNNLKTALLASFPGVILGILPAGVVAANGFIVGQTIHGAAVVAGEGYPHVALALLPHGVLEVPAILLSAATGLRLGHTLLRTLRGQPAPPLQQEARNALRTITRLVAPLLLLAAFIEIYITAALVRP